MSFNGLGERLDFLLADLEIFGRLAWGAFFELLADAFRAGFALRAAGFFAVFFFFDLAIT